MNLENLELLLTPPGSGVHTVSTGDTPRKAYHKKLYGTEQLEQVQKKWKEQLQNIESQNLYLLGIPSDCGGGILRGANWGPLYLREQISLESFLDVGDVKTIPHLLHDKYLNQQTISHIQNQLFESKNLPVSPLSIAEHICSDLYKSNENKKILGLGGDHSVSYPLVKAWLENKQKHGKKCAIVHFDAHTDLMDQRLGVDICFGSWAYHIVQLLDDPRNLHQYGIRATNKSRSDWEKKLDIHQTWASEFRSRSLTDISTLLVQRLEKQNIDDVYITVDIDALDAQYASATGTPEEQGLAPHEIIYLIESVANKFEISGADLVEVAPFISSPKKDPKSPEPFTTLQSSKLILDSLIHSMER